MSPLSSRKTFCALILAFAVSAAAVPLQAPFVLRDVDNVEHRQAAWRNKRAVVVFFTTIDCPLSNGYVPEMNRLQKEYAARGVAFYAVEADTTAKDSDVRRHAREYAFGFPVLFDKRQLLADLTGAMVTPEVAVLSNEGKVLYLGRIDNRVEDFDKRRNVITEHDLKDALEAVLAGRAVPRPKTKAVGCAINIIAETNKP